MHPASPHRESLTLVERRAGARLGRRSTTASHGAVASLILRLWACIGLAVVLLAPHAGASVGQGRALIDAGSADTVAVAELDHATTPCVHPRDDRRPGAEHGLGVVTSELSDEDSQSDAVAIPTATLPAFELIRLSGVSERARVDTGRPLAAAALARGPPAAG